jgi:hypothetical protein
MRSMHNFSESALVEQPAIGLFAQPGSGTAHTVSEPGCAKMARRDARLTPTSIRYQFPHRPEPDRYRCAQSTFYINNDIKEMNTTPCNKAHTIISTSQIHSMNKPGHHNNHRCSHHNSSSILTIGSRPTITPISHHHSINKRGHRNNHQCSHRNRCIFTIGSRPWQTSTSNGKFRANLLRAIQRLRLLPWCSTSSCGFPG